MEPQSTQNCHYVSRMLTTPWEEKDRFLRYYDFDTDRFGRKSSRSLFAANEINSDRVEQWLRDVVETPLGRIRASLARGDLEPLEQDWACHRAALLMVWLQGGRVSTLSDEVARQNLEHLASLSEPELNGLVMHMKDAFDLRLIFTESNGVGFLPLHVPSVGLFRYLLRDAGCLSGHSFGLALAIDIHCALLVTPTEKRGALDAVASRGLLTRASVGTSNARRVVIVPEVYEILGEDAIRDELRHWRRLNDQLVTLVEEKRELVGLAANEFGLQTEADGAGRIRYKRLR